MPAWPDEDDVPYTLITFQITDDAPFLYTMTEMIGGVCADLETEMCRIEESATPDDGRVIRLSIQGDESDAVMLIRELSEENDYVIHKNCKVMTTNHPEEFDCTNLWPEEALTETMLALGMHRHQLSFAIPPWFPFSLISSIVQDSVIGICTEAGISDGEVAGFGIDKTSPGFPTVHLWCSTYVLAAFADAGLQTLVEECIDYVAADSLIANWLERTVGDVGHFC
jgi:hypothetical protein